MKASLVGRTKSYNKNPNPKKVLHMDEILST
jgi:hypothetical protein